MINNETITSLMTDTETFRQKVIDAGIQGKLTEQLPEDGNAEDLYQQIQEEKVKLIKEGKIKKSKPLQEIKTEEISFEIPKSWKWVRLGDLFDHNTGKALNSSDKDGSLLTYITTSNVYWDHFELNNLKSMYFNESEIDKCTIQKGDLLICEGGDIGRSAIWPYKQEIRIQNHLHRLRPLLSEQLNVKFYYYVMWSYKLNGLINGRGIGLQGFSSKRVHSLIVPFPPVTEQKRIVDRIDEILGTQKHLAKSLEEYSTNVDALKSKVIDAGIQGKLTEQLPEDGNAEDLYQQIQAEKAKLVNEGKIKNSEPLPPIKPKEIPFEIPKNWRLVRFENISYIVRGGSPRPIKRYITNDENGINWIKIGDVEKGGKYIFSTKEKIIPEGEKKSRHVYPGDFLLTNSMSFGRPYISKIEGCIHDGWLLIRNLGGFNVDYLYYLLSSCFLYGQFTEKASGSTVDNLNIEKVNLSIIPLPPLSEQERIADKISEILNDI